MTNISIYLTHRKIVSVKVITTLLSIPDGKSRNVPLIDMWFEGSKNADDHLTLAFDKEQWEIFKKAINEYDYKYEDVVNMIQKQL